MHLRLHEEHAKLPNDPEAEPMAALDSLQWFAEVPPCYLPYAREYSSVLSYVDSDDI